MLQDFTCEGCGETKARIVFVRTISESKKTGVCRTCEQRGKKLKKEPVGNK